MKIGRRQFIKQGALWVPAAMAGIGGILRAGSAPTLNVSGTARIGSIVRPSGGQTYLVNEQCEGTGTPSGWVDAAGQGTEDWDYTTVILKGSQSLYLAQNFARTDYNLGSTYSELHFFARIRIRVTDSVTNRQDMIAGFRDSGDANWLVGWHWTSQPQETRLYVNGATGSASSYIIGVSEATYCWIDFFQNGTCTLAIAPASSGGTKPSSDTTSTVFLQGTAANSAAQRLRLYCCVNCGVVFDNILVSESPIGNNPNP